MNSDNKDLITQNASSTKILVVDDEKLLRESIQDLLSIYNLKCTLTADGAEALNLMSEQPFDIILLDLIMPNVDGYQVMETVQRLYPDTDIIVTSGEATFQSASSAIRHGVKNFLRKPYVPDELIKIINNLIEKRDLKHNLDKMHHAVKVSEQRYRFFVNSSPDIIFMLDHQGCISFINKQITEILGYTQEDCLGQHYSFFVHAEDIEKAHFIFNPRISNLDIPHKTELRIQAKYPTLDTPHFEIRSIAIKLNHDKAVDHLVNKESIGIYGVARDISEQKRLDKKLSYQLYHDTLTELPNRILFRDRINFALTQAKRNNTQLAIMLLDMDRFKLVNDTLGSITGDKLLQKITQRLRSCVRESDALGRVGGDEFGLMLSNINSRNDILHLIQNITHVLEQPVTINNNEIYSTFSIGIAVYPQDGDDTETLMSHASIAMYNIKGKGKNGHEFFSDHINPTWQQSLSIESGIRKAIQDDQFEIYFQPQYCTDSKAISGVEALIRWNHPQNGLIMPTNFIPLAEETGLINDIGEWVLEASCKKLQQWIARDSRLSYLKMAVNISAAQILTPNFVDFILTTLEKHQLKGKQLELEITENTLMQDMDLVVKKVTQLASHGIRFAVDDFGMGYSSLSYLQNLPLHNLKIDRSFISTIQTLGDTNSIITAIVAMAKELDMHIVAEGIENKIQADYVKALGCPTLQGYWCGRPMPTDQLLTIVLQQLGDSSLKLA